MAAITRDQYVAVVIPDRRIELPAALWAAESSYTQAAPTPGTPEAGGDSDLVLEASGSVAAGTTIETIAIQGGMPGVGAQAGGLGYRVSGETHYLGWEPPGSLSGWEIVEWSASGATFYGFAHIVTLSSGAVVVAYVDIDGNVKTRVRAETTGAWGSAVTVHDQTATGVAAAHPCLIVAGSRLLLLHWVPASGATDAEVHIRVHVSMDDGATWSVARRFATLDADVRTSVAYAGSATYERGRIRGVYQSGQLLVVAHLLADVTSGKVDRLRQYASADLVTLTTIETWSGTDEETSGGVHDVLAAGGVFVVGYLQEVDLGANVRRIVSAYQPLSTAGRIYTGALAFMSCTRSTPAGTATKIDDGDLCLTVGDDGVLWAYNRLATVSTHRIIVACSADAGRTWEPYSIDPTDPTSPTKPGVMWNSADTGSNYPKRFSACFQRGRVLMACNWYAQDGGNDGSLAVAYLGGWSTVTLPPTRSGAGFRNRANYWRTFLPIERPDDQSSWTMTTAGTSSSTLQTDGAQRFTTGDGIVAGTHWAGATDATTGDIACLCTVTVHPGANGDHTDSRIGLRIRCGSATHGATVTLQPARTAFRIVDSGGANLITVTGLSNAAREYRIGLRCSGSGVSRKVQVVYRTWDRHEARKWTEAGSAIPVDDLGATYTTNRVDWGHLSSSGGVATGQIVSDWYHGPHYSFGDIDGVNTGVGTAYHWHGWSSGADNPTGLSPRLLGVDPVYLGNGVAVRATDGPAMQGDTHTIPTRYGYPIERIFSAESRSPRARWRSTSTAEQQIAILLDATLGSTTNSSPGASHWALVLRGINWRTGRLERYNAGVGWATVVSIDAATGLAGMSYTRSGNVILPSGTPGPYLLRAECDGCTLSFSTGSVRRRILATGEGSWSSTGYAGAQARLTLSGVVGSDPTSAGTVSIWATELAVVFPAVDAAGYRLVIDNQTTVDGYHEIGQLLLGPCLYLPQVPGWGRAYDIEPGHARQVASDGTSYTQRARPSRRTVDIAWSDGIDTSRAHGSTPTPDHIQVTATGGVGSPGAPAATPYLVHGLVDELQDRIVAYLPRVAYGDAQHIRRRHELLVGTVRAGGRMECILGEEVSTEVVRVSTVTVEEEV